ncbi:MAG TPA: SAM-dependent chlorinase/fluorinase [Kiritimatiellia bacterium]|nr:SAM-dependent chlorinase/fluorinase [Kiritimatiellia bacterium]
MKAPVITLLTDFGTRDGYVAAMKGVLAGYAPGVPVADASHEIPPQNIFSAAWALAVFHRYYPPGTIHVVVVDPGVGTERLPLCVVADGRVYLAPDNGVLSLALEGAKEVLYRRIREEVHLPGQVSATFHGRDVFAYAAALLGSGEKTVEEVSERVEGMVRLSLAEVDTGPAWVQGAIVHVDGFGNMITNIREDHLRELGEGSWQVEAGRRFRFGAIRRTYGDVAGGELLALFNSSGYLELAANGGSAVAMTRLGLGDLVRVGR